FALPLFALILIAIAGGGDGTHSGARLLGVISGIIFFVVTTFLVLVVRADRTADWVGRTIDRWVGLLLGRLRRPEHPDVNAGIHSFRDELGEVVRRRGLDGHVRIRGALH